MPRLVLITESPSKTSYPGSPSRSDPARHYIAGGFVLDTATCIALASRIGNISLDPEVTKDCSMAFGIIMMKVEKKPYNTTFNSIYNGDQVDRMIITQLEPFQGWEEMDPKLIPKLKEGPHEAIARKLLAEEGGLTFLFCLST